MKRFPLILTIFATVLFIVVLYIDVSSFGENQQAFIESIDVPQLVLAVVIVLGFGIFLGLLLFRRRQFSKRLQFTIPIAFILFSLIEITVVTIGYYGLNEEYNRFAAKRDIENGKIQILSIGLILPSPGVDWEKEDSVNKIIDKHFGYTSKYLGCIVTQGTSMYNAVMKEYLNKLNGEGWEVKRQRMRDSLIKLIAN